MSPYHPLVRVGCLPCIIGAPRPVVGGIFGDIGDFFEDVGGEFATFGKSVFSAGSSAASSLATDVIAPNVKNAVPFIQQALKNLGPIGMVASGALGALAAGLSGGDLEAIAWAAAEGAAPTGVDAAVRAARSLRNGDNVIGTALNVAASQFVPGSVQDKGFKKALELLTNPNVTRAAIDTARAALSREPNGPELVAAFNAGIGTAAMAETRQVRPSQLQSTTVRPVLTSAPPRERSVVPTTQSALPSLSTSKARFISAEPAARPDPLPGQPQLSPSVPTAGIAILSDGGKLMGRRYLRASSGVRAILVMADGRMSRDMYRVV